MSGDAQHGGKRKLIEVSLPLETINKESAREKSIRHGHPSTLHLWWARRPLAAARAVLFAQLVDDPAYLLKICTACGIRYMGAERGEEFGRRNAVPEEIIVRVRPTRVLFNSDVTA